MKNENATSKEISFFNHPDQLTVLPIEIFNYLSTFLDWPAITRLMQTGSKYYKFFKKEFDRHIIFLRFNNYALSHGLFAKPTFKLEDTHEIILKKIQYIQDPLSQQIAKAVLENDVSTFSNLCQKHFNLLENELNQELEEQHIFILSALFLLAIGPRPLFRQIAWQ